MNNYTDIESYLIAKLDAINEPIGLVLIGLLGFSALWFTIRTKGVQFRFLREMFRLLLFGGSDTKGKHVSSFQAFCLSLASRVGTGNLAGVATAIFLGGPGAIFWMWVMALLGSVNAFIECTLAQLFKIRGKDSFIGGPAYYISKGLKKKWFAYIFVISIIIVFGLTNNMVQSNTISLAFNTAFGVSIDWMAFVLVGLSLLVIFGGIQRIAKVSAVIVPLMAFLYLILTIIVIILRYDRIPEMFKLIVTNAFGIGQFMGGGVGMAIIIGFKRGLFSNEAGEGSAPNAAATAVVSHPVKQGLIQTLGVFTDTLVICTCTAFIILCSGLYTSGATGIELTQISIVNEIGSIGAPIIAIMIFFFAFTSIIGNYYYGECNLYFITKSKKALLIYRLAVGALILIGAVSSLELAWSMVDLFMAIMAITNLIAILLLGKYAIRCLYDYEHQLRLGKDPVYRSSTIPEIAKDTECWDD